MSVDQRMASGVFGHHNQTWEMGRSEKIWARNFPLFHLICFFQTQELMKSNPSNLGGKKQGRQRHQETKLNGSEQCLYWQACLWFTNKRQWHQSLMNQQDVHPAIQTAGIWPPEDCYATRKGDRVEADKGIATTANDATPR